MKKTHGLGAAVLCAVAMSAPRAGTQALEGIWDATVVVNKVAIPFRMQIAGNGANAQGSFFNGEEKVTSTTGHFTGWSLRLTYPEYGSRLEATLKDGHLSGEYVRATGNPYPFEARRFTPARLDGSEVPSIGGLWNVQVKSSKGEDAWRLMLRQSGAEVSGAILRVDGDTGTLTGTYQRGRFVLSHFSGARPLLLELTLARDGSLQILQNRQQTLTAVRAEVAQIKGLPEPVDPTRWTSVRDPSVPFAFSFPDLAGNIVANTDPRFRGKVVIVNIGGSWCPNCHDEAPFLVELYQRYQSKGLEIVLLDFEQAEQLQNPTRLRAFVQRYGITYPVLLAGVPDDLEKKIPQAVNLNSYPTTFFLGRDGLVRGVHAGFASRASGSYHTQLKEEITERVERLLEEN